MKKITRLKSSASSRLAKRAEKSADATKKKLVSYRRDELPPITEAERDRLRKLAARPDSEIDLSDIPELTEEFWKNAVRGRFYRPTKTSTTVRIDSDVLAWLRAGGKGYQSRLNAILRREMLTAHKRSA